MLNSRLRLRPLVGLHGRRHHGLFPSPRSQALRPPSTARSYSHQNWSHQEDPYSDIPVRLIRPTIWSIAAITTIYFTCGAYDVYQDVKKYPKDSRRGLDFDRIEAQKVTRSIHDSFSHPQFSRSEPIFQSSPIALWQSLSGTNQVITSLAITNVGVYVLERAVARSKSSAANLMMANLAHFPAEGAFRNWQLLTSTFMHAGAWHLGLNMLAFCNFAPYLSRTAVFDNSGSHMLAFFLSGGILSALGGHISTRFWPNKASRLIPHLGFSGVGLAVFAAFCTQYPESRLRVFPIPYSFTSHDMLEYSAAFEIAGVLGVFKLLRIPLQIGFAAHLSGLAFGAAYMHYGRNGAFFTPFRRAAFRTMRTVGLV